MKKYFLALLVTLSFMVMGLAQAADRVIENKEYGIKATVPSTWKVEENTDNILAASSEDGMLQVYAAKQELNNVTDLRQLNEEGRKGYATMMAKGFAEMGFKVGCEYGGWKNQNVLAIYLAGKDHGKDVVGVSYSMIRNNKHILVTAMTVNEPEKVQALDKLLESMEL